MSRPKICGTCSHEAEAHAGENHSGDCSAEGCTCKGFQYDHDKEDDDFHKEGHWYTR